MDKSIKLEKYSERSEKDYKQARQYYRNIQHFMKLRSILHSPTQQMYTYIKNFCIDTVRNHVQIPPKHCWKPKIVDVGCGGGFGSYILSHEADFVWGIDIDEQSIRWAKAVFEKHKNGMYYSSQLTFDVIDIRDDPREFMKFDIVVCIEVIEHINDYGKVLNFIKGRFKKAKDGTWKDYPEGSIAFISSPNRNHPKMGKETPHNSRHVREWTPAELYDILTKHFQKVILLNSVGEKRDLDMMDSAMLFKCELPICE